MVLVMTRGRSCCSAPSERACAERSMRRTRPAHVDPSEASTMDDASRRRERRRSRCRVDVEAEEEAEDNASRAAKRRVKCNSTREGSTRRSRRRVCARAKQWVQPACLHAHSHLGANSPPSLRLHQHPPPLP